jgi:hypothetical protein
METNISAYRSFENCVPVPNTSCVESMLRSFIDISSALVARVAIWL